MRAKERLASLSPTQLSDAREWLGQLTFRDVDEEDIKDPKLVTDLNVVQALEKHYSGGWKAFLETNF